MSDLLLLLKSWSGVLLFDLNLSPVCIRFLKFGPSLDLVVKSLDSSSFNAFFALLFAINQFAVDELVFVT